MTTKTRPPLQEVTDCRGGKSHPIEVIFPPTLTAPGFIKIGQESYQVTCDGSMDDFVFRKTDGKTEYHVSCWGDQPANRLCLDYLREWYGTEPAIDSTLKQAMDQSDCAMIRMAFGR